MSHQQIQSSTTSHKLWNRLNTILRGIEQTIGPYKHITETVDADVGFLKPIWNQLTENAQNAMVTRLEAAASLAKPKASTFVVPDVYALIKEAQSTLANGQEWTIPIPLQVFKRALHALWIRLMQKSEEAIENSDIFLRWDAFKPSAQLAILDITYNKLSGIALETESARNSEPKRARYLIPFYPSLEEFEQVVRLSKVDEPERHHAQHSSTLMGPPPRPPPRPSHAGPARSISTAPSQFRAQDRNPPSSASANPPRPSDPGWLSFFHSGRVVPHDHIAAARAAQYSSQGTRENPFNIN